MTYLIALDDGHGANTPGKRTPYIKSLGRQVHENEFNKPVVNYLKEELERCGFETLLVAPTDKDTSLTDRTNLANRKGADAYVSVHFNAFDGSFSGSNPSGISLHVYNGHRNKDAGKLAESIAKYLRKGTKQNYRGIKEDNFHVLRETSMIAVLTENGFMDNEREAKLMLDKDFQKEVAQEHAKGICDYFNVEYKTGEKSNKIVDRDEKVKSEKVYDYIEHGDKGAEVTKLQKRLIELGYDLPKYGADGHFGDETENAVREFQDDQGISVDGIVGPVTQKHLDKANKPSNKRYVTLPASAKTWRTYKLNVQPVKRNSTWSLTPSAFGGLTYEILDEPYPNVVTIKTSRGKRNIYVAPSTGAKIK